MKSIPKIFGWICFTIWLCQSHLWCADIEKVSGLHAITHVSHQVSNNTQITVVWEAPITGLHNITGYYYLFNDNSSYVFTMENTAYGQAVYVPKDAPRVAVSPNYANLDDKPVYCHVAAVNEMDEIMGPTHTVGPYRIDDTPPFPATVVTPSVTSDIVISLLMGAQNASEMNISTHAYGRGLWEPFQQVRTWQLDEIIGTQILYVCFRDAAGNISQTQTAVWYDNVRATVTLQAQTTKTVLAYPIPVTITFDEIMTDFNLDDIVVVNGKLANFKCQPDSSGFASVYSLTVQPSDQGLVTLYVPENAANDLAQNGNVISKTLSIIYDSLKPTVSLYSAIPQHTNSDEIPITITFSEPVYDFTTGNIYTQNAIPEQFNTLGSTAPYSRYSFVLKASGEGLVSAQIQADSARDVVGHTNSASSMIAFNYDITPPDATIETSYTETSLSPVSVTIVFNELCRLTSIDAIQLTNATMTNSSNTSSYYTRLCFQLTPQLLENIEITLKPDTFYDQAHNYNAKSVSITIPFDSQKPTVLIGSDTLSPTYFTQIPVWIKFNKPVTSFESDDITLSNAQILEFTKVTSSQYEIKIAFESPGKTQVLIPQGVAQDVSGFTNFPAAIYEIMFDPNTPQVLNPIENISCFEDQTAGPVSTSVSDAEGGTYTVFVQTSNLLSVESGNLTLCVENNCQAMPIEGLLLNAQEQKNIQLFVRPLPNVNGTASLTICVMDNVYTVSQSFTLDITPVNDPPVLKIQHNPIIYTENDPPAIIAQSATVTDLDSSNFNGGRLIVDFVEPHEDNLLEIISQGTDPGLISVTLGEIFWGNTYFANYTGGNGTIPLTVYFDNSVADSDAIASLIECITYVNMSELPVDGNTQVRFQVDDGDGGLSLPETNTVSVISINDPAEVTLSTKSVAYTENQTPVAVSEYARVKDLDAVTWQAYELRFEITKNGTPFDRLTIQDQGDSYGSIGVNGIDVKHSGKRVGQWSGGTNPDEPLIVIFNDLATYISVFKVIEAVTYHTESDMPSIEDRTVTIKLTEPDGTTSGPLIRTISVTSDNDPPEHHVPAPIVMDEDSIVVLSGSRGIYVTDPDILNNDLRMTITVDNGTITLGTTDNIDFLTGDGFRDTVLVINGKISHINQAIDGIIFYPDPNFSGLSGITFRTSDLGATGSNGIPKTDSDTIVIDIQEVPDAPQMSDPGIFSLPEDTIDSVGLHLTDVDGGIIHLSVISANTNLIPSSQISLTSSTLSPIDDGYTILTSKGAVYPITMTIQPAPDQYGETDVSIILYDADGLSFTRNIHVNVQPVNDMPQISSVDNQETIEDTPSASIPLTVTDLESAPESFSFSVNASEPSKISDVTFNGQGIHRTMIVHPALDAVGFVQITITVWDDQEGSAQTSFGLNIIPVNDTPVVYLQETAGGPEDQATIIHWSLIDADGDLLRISAISTNEDRVPDENIIIQGPNVQQTEDTFTLQTSAGEPSNLSLIIYPLENQNGEVNVIMTITDSGMVPMMAKCLLHITPVNDPPTIASIETQQTDEDMYAFLPIQVADIDNLTEDLIISAHSLNLTLVSDDGFQIEKQGQNTHLIITPQDNQNGTARIAVSVFDPEGLSATTQFDLNILPQNDAPTITKIENQITAINIPIDPIPFMIHDFETSANELTLTAKPSIAIDMHFSGTDNNRLLHITNPQTYQGLIFIDITVADSEQLTSSTSFTLTITEHNDPPVISEITDQVIQEDGILQNLEFTISDIQSPASDLDVSIQSMNEYLVPQQNISIDGTGAMRQLTMKPVRNRSGDTVIQIMVKDPYGLKTTLEFTLTVLADNDSPILSLVPPGACGNRFTILHDLSGRSVAFGLNDLGQLGIGKPDNQFTPVPMMNNVRQLFAGELHAAALTSDGSIYVWGSNDFKQLGIENLVSANTPQLMPTPINNVQRMALGERHSIALNQDGNLYVWGDNTFGQTGTGILEPIKTPVLLSHNNDNQLLNPMVSISAGKFHSVALDRTGTVWTWGRNEWGQIGDGSQTTRNLPVQVLDSDGGFFQGVVAIASGENFVLALTNDGLVWAWGENSSGQLGLPREEKSRQYPHLIDIKKPCKAVAAGHQHALALTTDGYVMAWGNNTYGQLGIGTYISTHMPSKVMMENSNLPLDHVQSIAAGDDHSMAIQNNGHVMLWGKNSSGQLGDSTPTDRLNPVPLPGNDPDGLYNVFTFFEDHDSVPFAWMSADAETESQFLSATAQSYDLSMIQQENISIAHVNGESVLQFTPVPDAQGMANICVSLSDAQHMAVTSCIELYIENINDTPGIEQVPALKTSENDMLGPIILRISDLESEAKNLTITGSSLTPEMVRESDITIVGSGYSRLLFIETRPQTHGTVTIVLTVHDPQGLTQSIQFPLFINDRPDIIAPSFIYLTEDQPFPFNFSVADIESEPCSITPVIVSANQSLINAEAIVFTCNNNQFDAKIFPQTNKSGACMLTLIVSDDMAESIHHITAVIQPVNDPPEIHVAQPIKTYTENAQPLLVCSDAELVDVDSLSFDLGLLSVKLTENAEMQDRLFIQNSNDTNAIQVIEISGNLNVFYSGIPLGTITGGQTGYSPLVIHLSNNVPRQALSKLIQQIAFIHESDKPDATDRHMTVTLNESDKTAGIPASLTIPVAAINDDPQLYLGNTAISNAIELSSLYEKEQLIFNNTHIELLTIKDPDVLANPLTLEINTEKGIILLNADAAIQLTRHSTTRITVSGSLTSVNTALESMVYSAFADVQGKEIISIAIMDHGHNGVGGGQWQIFELHTIILSDNDPPQIQPLSDQYVDEDTEISIPFAVTDVDGDDIVLTIASFASDIIQPDRISLTGPAIINGSDGQYTIRVGVDASASLTLVCRPEMNQAGEVPFILTALDPEQYSHVHEFSIYVRQVNDPPHLSGMFTPMTYIENSSPITFCRGINLIDPDDNEMVQAVVRIVENYQYGDQLSQNLYGNIIAVADGSSLTFLGVSSWTDYESVLDSLTFEHTTDNPDENSRTIVITVNDGVDNSAAITRTIYVQGSNDRPGLWLDNEQVKDFKTIPDILEENQLRFNHEENYLEIRDPDVRDGIMTIRISANKGFLTLNALGTQNLTIVQGKFEHFDSVIFQGQITDINNALNGMYYWASPDELGDAHIVIQMNDNGFSGDGPGLDVIQMLSFQINAVNDPPVIAKINSRVTLEDTAVSIPVSLSDQESDPLTIWLESDNPLLVNPSECTFIGDRILLVNKNKYVIDTSGTAAQITAVINPSEDSYGQTMLTVLATDGQLTETRRFSFSVLSDNDPPKFTVIPSESYPEALTVLYLDLNPYVLDIDHPDEQLQWTASCNSLDVSISKGLLTMHPPDTDWYGTASVYITVTDPEGLSLTGTITIEITPVADPPIISLVPDQVFALGADIPILPFTVTDAEGGNLKITINSFNETIIPDNDTALSINGNGKNYQFTADAGSTTSLSLSIVPVDNIGGSADICMTVTDDTQLSTTSCFNVHMAPYLITAIAGSHGKIDPEGIIAIDKEGAYLPFYFIPDPTYQVDMVIVDGKSVGPVSEYIFFDIRDNHSIRVSFRTADTFIITPKAGQGGSIEPSEAQTVYAGDDFAFSIHPDEGYAVADVRIDNVSIGNVKTYQFENISKDHEIAAYFKAVAKPLAQFNASPTTGYAPLTVQMENQSQGDIDSYKWNFGDNSDSGLPAPVHTYASPGTYSVSLTVNGPGGTDFLVRENFITVERMPVQIDFQADQRLGVAPLMVQFIESASDDNIISRHWNFGDGQTSHVINPSHTYEEPGNYAVSLTVTADAGTRVIEKKNYIQVLGRTISGNVTGDDIGNQGLSGYNISVWQENTVIAETTTDIYGNYTLLNLPVHASLYVAACPPDGDSKYFCQYYNQQDTLEKAQPVSTMTANLQHIDFVLETAPNNGISGEIINQSGFNETFIIEIWSESIGMGRSVTADINNRFEFKGLRPASDYRVYVWSSALQQFFYYTIPSGETPGHYLPTTSASAWQAATKVPVDMAELAYINIFIHSDPFIRGKVLVDGEPLANQWVNAWSSALQAGFGAFTNGLGEYEIVGLLPEHEGAPVSYIVEVQDSPYPYQVYDNQTQRENATLVYVNTDQVDFNLQGGASISGTVTDFNGLPLSQVTVSAQSQSTEGRGAAVTDINGDYLIEGLPPASDYIVAVYPVYYPLTYYSNKSTKEEANLVDVSGAGAENIDFILQKGAIIRGYLFLETMDEPAPSGIWVNVWSESTQTGGDVPTDATGRFEITGLEADAADYVISVITPDYVPSFYAEDAPNQTVHKWELAQGVQPSRTIQRNLILIKGGQLSGRVTFNNVAIDGVYIEAWSTDIQAWRSVLSTDSATGPNYLIEGLLPGSYQIRFSHSQYIDVSKAITLSDGDNLLNMSMEKPNRQISGTILGLEVGTEATVTAWSIDMDVAESIHIKGNSSPVDYRFDNLKPGNDYRVEFRSTHYPLIVFDNVNHWADAHKIDITNGNAGNIDFDLPPPGRASIAGTITLPEMPQAGTSIWIDAYSDQLKTGKGLELIVSNQQIDYQLHGLQTASDYIVGVWSAQYQDLFYNQTSKRSKATRVNTNDANQINFILSSGGKISGYVTGTSNLPVYGMIIEVQSDQTGIYYGVVTDDRGYFHMDGLSQASDYIVAAHNPGESIQYYSADGMTINRKNATYLTINNNSISLQLSLIQTGWIKGKVTDETGKAITGIWVSAWSDTAQTGSSAHTDNDGRFTIAGLPDALDFQVSVQSVNGAYIDQTRGPIGVYAENVLFVMTKGFSFTGRVEDMDNNGHKNVTVVLWSSMSNIFRSVQTNISGEFDIQGLKASDDYILRVTPPSDVDLAIFQEKGIQLDASKTRTIVLTEGIRVQGNVQVLDRNSGAWTNYTQSTSISVYTKDNSFLVSGQSATNGTYVISNIPRQSTIIMRVSAPGFTPLELSLDTQAQTNEQDLKLVSGAAINGCIKDQSGRLIKHARIMIRSADAQMAVTGISDNQGCFEIAGLLDTVFDYEITVHADGYISQSKGAKQAGDTVHFTLFQTSPHAITGRILDRYRNVPPESVSVVVKLFKKTTDTFGGYIGKTQLDKNGYFSFIGLEAEQVYHIQCIAQLADGSEIVQWAMDDKGVGREGADDYLAGDDFEMIVDVVWE